MANPAGTCPTGIAATFVLVAVAITLTLVGVDSFRDVDVLPVWADGYRSWFDHYDLATTVLVAVAITETVLEPIFAT